MLIEIEGNVRINEIKNNFFFIFLKIYCQIVLDMKVRIISQLIIQKFSIIKFNFM